MKNYFNELKNESKNQTSYIKRFIAYAIDWYVGGLLASIPLILLYMSLHEDASYIPQVITIFEQPYQLIAGGLSFSVSLLYYIGIPLYTKGQTLGKKILGLKIVGDHYDDVTMKQILLRQGVMILLVEGSIYTASNMLAAICKVQAFPPTTISFIQPNKNSLPSEFPTIINANTTAMIAVAVFEAANFRHNADPKKKRECNQKSNANETLMDM